VQVEIGTASFAAIAVPAEGARRERLFAHVMRAVPGYGDYQTQTSRVLPVVALERAEPEAGARPLEVNNLADKLMEVHTWLRSQLRHVSAEADAHFAARAAHQGPGEPPAPGLGLQIRQHCLAFCLFPAIAHHNPHLRDAVDRLSDEHRTVARIQGELVVLLADIDAADPRHFRTELDRMSEELTAHLAYEEESLLPVLAEIPWPPAPVAD